MNLYNDALAKLNEFNVIGWYRGLSESQFQACDDLLHAIRDDTEQGTTYRVRQCLQRLGLTPMVDSKFLMEIIEISNYSDLAFLYFLWEAHYKSCATDIVELEYCDGNNYISTYTSNEQLLLSAIAHLDMSVTIRELDRILPPSSYSVKVQAAKRRRELAQQKLEKNRFNIMSRRNMTKMNVSPYFWKLQMPFYYGMRLDCEPPPLKSYFPQYEKYKNPYYVIPNERGRWFADYELQPVKRIVKKILTKEVNRLIFGGTMELNEKQRDSLCKSHKLAKQLNDMKAEEIKLRTFQKFRNLLDVPGAEQKFRRNRVVQQLEQEIDCWTAKMREFWQQRKANVVSLASANCVYCKHIATVPPRRRANLSILLSHGNDVAREYLDPKDRHIVNIQTLKGQKVEGKSCLLGIDTQTMNITEDCTPSKISLDVQKEKRKSKRRTSLKKRKSSAVSSVNKVKNCDSLLSLNIKNKSSSLYDSSKTYTGIKRVQPKRECCKDNQFPTYNKTDYLLEVKKKCKLAGDAVEKVETESSFFKATSMHAPYRFDYQTIFSVIEKDKSIIEKYFVNALNVSDEGQSWPNVSNASEKNLPLSADPQSRILRAADNCALNIFCNGAANSTKQVPIQKGDVCHPVVLLEKFFSMESLDPDDNELMGQLLKAAILKLRKNPQFVLAALPYAYKLPILHEWVLRRYKKSYTRHDFEKLIDFSFNVYHGLEHTYIKGPPHPNTRLEITPKFYKPKLHQKNIMREFYYQKLNHTFLEESRKYWLAMHGYQCLNVNYKDPYFAYMPSRANSIFHRNIWRSDDYRNIYKYRLFNNPKIKLQVDNNNINEVFNRY